MAKKPSPKKCPHCKCALRAQGAYRHVKSCANLSPAERKKANQAREARYKRLHKAKSTRRSASDVVAHELEATSRVARDLIDNGATRDVPVPTVAERLASLETSMLHVRDLLMLASKSISNALNE